MFQIPPASDVQQPQILEVTLKKSLWDRIGSFAWGAIKVFIFFALIGAIIKGSEIENTGKETSYDTTPIDEYYREVPYDETAKHIAVIDVKGTITDENISPSSANGMVVAPQLIGLLADAADDSDIAAILLRVDSPGGEVGASERITTMIDEIVHTQKRPVYVLMENMAASGGYYISTPATKIYAYPETLLGNIGVRMDMPNVEGLLEKIGVKMESLESGEYKTMGSPFRPMKDEEKAIFNTLLQESYEKFVDRVATGRNLPKETVRKLADGRIYSGTQGAENKLIDKTVNSLGEVLFDLRTEMGTSVQLVKFQYPLSPWDEFLMTMSTSVSPLKSSLSGALGMGMKYE